MIGISFSDSACAPQELLWPSFDMGTLWFRQSLNGR